MKKFYILFVLLLTGIWTSAAQPFWHPDLGYVNAGSIPLSADAQTYSFETYGGLDAGYDLEGMANDLNRQLLTAGFSWVRVTSVESYADEQFTVTLRLDEYTGVGSRAVYFGTNDRMLEIRQRGTDDTPDPEIPADRTILIAPGCPCDLTIDDTNVGEIYTIYNYDADVPQAVASITGTGGRCVFENLYLTPGRYSVNDLESFDVKYLLMFQAMYEELSDTAVTISADGGIAKVYFSYAHGKEEAIIESFEDMERVCPDGCEAYNSGDSRSWNSHMRLGFGYDEAEQRMYYAISCPPNLSGGEIVNNSYLQDAYGRCLVITQPAGGSLRQCDVDFIADEASQRLRTVVHQTQPYVRYELSRDRATVATGLGNDADCELSCDIASGLYVLSASYAGQTLPLDSVRIVGNRIIETTNSENWILRCRLNDTGPMIDLTYYDGLGYAEQEIAIDAVDNGVSDLVRPIAYDEWHREAYKYLPFVFGNNRGRYVDKAVSAQNAFYSMRYGHQGSNVYPYICDEYESSPLNRILRSYKPGAEYRAGEHALHNDYSGNDALSVLRLDVDPATQALCINGYYGANELSVVKTTDEDGAVSVVYTDKEQRTVCEERRLRDDDGTVDPVFTHYVYDDCGRLAWVVTPEGAAQLIQGRQYSVNDDFAKSYCYRYEYDARSRVVGKRSPGREEEHLVYDSADRIAMQQDGNLRVRKRWLRFTYDAFGRVLEQSLVEDSEVQGTARRDTLQAAFDTGSAPDLYTMADATLIYRHMYDEYPADLRKELDFANLPALTEAEDERTVGLPVYEKLAVLNENGVDGYRERVFYYDSKGRAIQRVECDEDGDNLLRISNKYDFAGNIVAQRESYTYGGKTDDLDRTFSYDTRDRLVKETARLNNGEQAVVNHTYDDLGQLTGKTYGTGVYAIHETMDYNIQGWLTEKSSELFEMNLRYFDPRRDWVAASYTGNITEWKWQHKQVDGATLCDDYTYAYTYDDLGRLQSADLYSRDDDTLDGAVSGFSERMSYDKNSNILTLNRQGSPDENVQSYGFEYIGNQRTKERNSNSSYGYDANGNMTEDALTGFGMSYNILNLPEYIQDNWGSGEISHRYSYLADGTKTSVGDYENSGYQYAGSLVYSMDYGTVNSFESASFGGGRIVGTNDGTSSEVYYFLTDHLGSTRVVAKVTPTRREDLDRKDYYPFGKAWEQPDMPTSDNRYTFSGKEIQQTYSSSAHYLDFSARFYDPEGVTFLQQDPLLEKYFRIGAYNYCAGNPIRFSDKKGQSIKDAAVGYAIGFVTNIIPGTTGLRDSYTPTDPVDYNNALQTSDILAGITGNKLSESGEGLMATGMAVGSLAAGTTMATAGASAEVTVPLATIGEGVALTGLGMKALGITLMGNAANNASQGYNRGKAKIESSKEKQYKRISPNQMKKMQENGFEPHGYKPKQGNGQKIDYYKDQQGNIYYSTPDGAHFEPTYMNIHDYLIQ